MLAPLPLLMMIPTSLIEIIAPVVVLTGRYVSPFELASIYFALAQTDEGFAWLTKAFQDRCFELICLRVDPRWQSLRDNTRFQMLLGQLGLP